MILGAAAAGGGLLLCRPAIAYRSRPVPTHGVQSGDADASSAVLWARADRPARVRAELAATERFRNPRVVVGPDATVASDFTVKLLVDGLPAG